MGIFFLPLRVRLLQILRLWGLGCQIRFVNDGRLLLSNKLSASMHQALHKSSVAVRERRSQEYS